MPWLTSRISRTRSAASGVQELGQPEPESYLVFDDEQGVTATHASVRAGIFVVSVGAGERTLGAFVLASRSYASDDSRPAQLVARRVRFP
jgi:hypothetical protein